MPRFLDVALLGAALIIPVTIAPTALRAEDYKTRTYHDAKNNEDHQWNNQEEKAYRIYAKEAHRRRNFAKLSDSEQQAYWGWRHEHSDVLLNIDIR
jgi:hypothetical protein